MDRTRERQLGALGLCALSVPAVLFLPRGGWTAALMVTAVSMLMAVFGRSVGVREVSKWDRLLSMPLFLWNIMIIGKLAWELSSVHGVDSPLPGLLLLLLSGYAVKKEVVSVVGAVLVFLLGGIYGIVYLCAIPVMDLGELTPQLGETATLAYGFLPLLLLYMYRGRKRERIPWALAGIALVLGAAIITGAMGARDFYTAAKSVNLFGTMERWEPLIGVAVTAGGFCLLSMLFSVNKNIWESVWERKKNFPSEILVCICVGLILTVGKKPGLFWALGTTVCWGLFPILTQFVVHKKKD